MGVWVFILGLISDWELGICRKGYTPGRLTRMAKTSSGDRVDSPVATAVGAFVRVSFWAVSVAHQRNLKVFR